MHELESIQLPGIPAFERHYSVKEIAKRWGLSTDVVRKLFANEGGVFRYEHEETLHKRSYCTLRIPESVVERVHRKLTTRSGKTN